MKLYCKKYGILLALEELESHKCLEKFEHLGKKGICPCLLDAETGNPYWQEIYKPRKETTKEESVEDILEKTAKILANIKRAGLTIEKEGMFKT